MSGRASPLKVLGDTQSSLVPVVVSSCLAFIVTSTFGRLASHAGWINLG